MSKPRMTVVLVLLLSWLVVGCAENAVGTHAKAAQTMRMVLDAARNGIQTTCMSRIEAEETAEGVRTVLDHCERAAASHRAAQLAWHMWVDALLEAYSSTFDAGSAVRLGSGMMSTWLEMMSIAEDLGFRLPGPPEELQALVQTHD